MPRAPGAAVLVAVLLLLAACTGVGEERPAGACDLSVGDVRGMGLLCGLELVEDRDSRRPAEAMGLALTEECERRGLSVNLVRGGTGGAANCLRMAPPLTISDDEIDLAAEILDASLAALPRTANA